MKPGGAVAENGRVRITMLGPLAVDGRAVRGERLATVVRELVSARGRSVSSAALAEAVWHGDPPEDAAGAVQALISRVRRLGVPVLAGPGGYRTPADEVETDVAAARELAGRARAALDAKADREAGRWSREKETLEERLRQARVPRHLRPV